MNREDTLEAQKYGWNELDQACVAQFVHWRDFVIIRSTRKRERGREILREKFSDPGRTCPSERFHE